MRHTLRGMYGTPEAGTNGDGTPHPAPRCPGPLVRTRTRGPYVLYGGGSAYVSAQSEAFAPPVTLMRTLARGRFHTLVSSSMAVSTLLLSFMGGILANLAGPLSVFGNVSAPARSIPAFFRFVIVSSARATILPRVPCMTSGESLLDRTGGSCETRRCADNLLGSDDILAVFIRRAPCRAMSGYATRAASTSKLRWVIYLHVNRHEEEESEGK